MKSNNIIRTLTLLLFSTFFQLAICQENFLPGYIIKLNGDTLHGYIDYQNWDINPNKISFKSTLSNEKSDYTPIDIKEFRVNNEIYESANIKFETSSNNTNDLSRSPKFAFENDHTFLQALIKGEKSLYLYKNKDNAKEQFYIKEDSLFELLMYRKYLNVLSNNIVTSENKKYIGQLAVYFQNCPTIYSKIEKTEYKSNSLEKLFDLYYNCIQSNRLFQKKKEILPIETGLFIGASLTSVNFASNILPYLVKANYSQPANLTLGLSVNITLPRTKRRLSIYNELMYSSYKTNGTYDDYSNNVRHNIYNTTIGYSYIKMNNMFRYKFPINKTYIYLNAGFSNGVGFSEKNNLKEESVLFSSSTIEEGKAIEDSKKYEIGYLVGLGAIFSNKYSLELRLEQGNGMSADQNLNSFINRYFLLLAYKL